jgi:glutathione S-transferase
MFANASLGPAIFVEEMRKKQMEQLFGVMDQILSKQPYLLGSQFSVADVACGAYLAYLPIFFPDIKLDPWTHLQTYVGTLTARPAFKNTVGAPPPTPASP